MSPAPSRLLRLILAATLAVALACLRAPAPVRAQTGSSQPTSIATGSRPGWQWPTSTIAVSHGFQAPVTEYARGHRGIDFVAAGGDIVRAAHSGRVSFVGNVAGTSIVSIDHGGGWVSTYLPVISSVILHQEVTQGDEIGRVALDVSHCACLHFGVRINDGYVSPLLVLGDIPRAVILPW